MTCIAVRLRQVTPAVRVSTKSLKILIAALSSSVAYCIHPFIGNSSGRQNHGRENLCSVRLQVGSGFHQGQNRWQDGRSVLRRVRPEAEGSQFFVKGGLSYECESTNYEPSSPAMADSAARRRDKNKGSNGPLSLLLRRTELSAVARDDGS